MNRWFKGKRLWLNRYVEAKGGNEIAHQGRYRVTGDYIEYWDDAGFTADGTFIKDVLTMLE